MRESVIRQSSGQTLCFDTSADVGTGGRLDATVLLLELAGSASLSALWSRSLQAREQAEGRPSTHCLGRLSCGASNV
jgi:hypothetical protein